MATLMLCPRTTKYFLLCRRINFKSPYKKIETSSKSSLLPFITSNQGSLHSLQSSPVRMETQKRSTTGGRPSKVKLICSFGGKIHPRPHDHHLTYLGGDRKILTVDRNIRFCDIFSKLASLCGCDGGFCIKYQLPGEGLDALISVVDDDDVEHMMFEYDRLHRCSPKLARLRLFLFSLRSPVKVGTLNMDLLSGVDEQQWQLKTNLALEIPGAVVGPGNCGANTPEMNELQMAVVGEMGQELRGSHVMSKHGKESQSVYRAPVPAVAFGTGRYSNNRGVMAGINRE